MDKRSFKKQGDWRLRRVVLSFVFVLASTPFASAAQKVEILRDEYGMPHIFAATPAAAAYGSGYVQAEDRLAELLRDLRLAQGTMAEVFGPEWFPHDYAQRVWAHARIAKERYPELSPELRAIVEAFCAGINRYVEEHPRELPAWGFKVDPWMIVARSRYAVWVRIQNEASSILRRGGIADDSVPAGASLSDKSRGILIGPSLTASRAVMAIIDPQASWSGETRPYAVHLSGGGLEWSGSMPLGLPIPILGHSANVSIAMAGLDAGAPDSASIFAEEIADGKYKFQGEWRPLAVVHEAIQVKDGSRTRARDVTIEYTQHGPIWSRRDGKTYSIATPYQSEFRMLEQAWAIANAKNLPEMKHALAMREYGPATIMIGTADGEIYEVRNSRPPEYPEGCDVSLPLDGNGACESRGTRPFEDLTQVANPARGYLENAGPPAQASAMSLALLAAGTRFIFHEAVDLAFSTEVYKAKEWQLRIARAAPDSEFARMLTGWSRRSDANSRPALAFYLFKMALGSDASAVEPPSSVSDDRIRAALRKAQDRLETEFPVDGAYGTLFRVGQVGSLHNYPASGGTVSEAGMATPRAIEFEKRGRVLSGTGGQVATQVVELARPVKSFMLLPLGESGHPESGHYDDQAAKLFGTATAVPTYFGNRKELEKHATSRKALMAPL